MIHIGMGNNPGHFHQIRSGEKIMFKIKSLCLFLVLLSISFLPLVALAENCDIPRELYARRDDLLAERRHLQELRAEIISTLNKWDLDVKQGDDVLRTNPPNRQEILFYRAKVIANIRQGDGIKESIERDLLANNEDLRRVESDIYHYAAYK